MNNSPSTNDAKLLADRIAVQDVVCAVSVHTDCKEYWEPLQYYTEDAIMDYTSLFGAERGRVPVRVQREQTMEFLPGLDFTHHQTTNFQISIEGDEATSRAQVRTTNGIGDQIQVVGGTYHHRLRRTKAGWKIYYHRFDVLFSQGPDLFEPARRRVEEQRAQQPASA